MTLAPGVRLGPYEILSPIGAGGMGEVYKARDTRLDRTVAVKVLPAGMAADPQVRERFEREARSISALNHPNICTVHDVGRHRVSDQDVDYLVMEYLDGETLAARLTRGPVPLAESAAKWTIGTGTAAAGAAAATVETASTPSSRARRAPCEEHQRRRMWRGVIGTRGVASCPGEIRESRNGSGKAREFKDFKDYVGKRAQAGKMAPRGLRKLRV